MSRLPIPGGDDGTWGDILNDFLDVSHNADGTLKAISESGVTNLTADLAAKVSASDVGAASGVAALDNSGNVPVDQLGNAPSAPNATTSTKGILQLDGDLSGTAGSPTVQGLQGNFVAPTPPGDGQVLTWINGSSEWKPATPTAPPVTSVARKTRAG